MVFSVTQTGREHSMSEALTRLLNNPSVPVQYREVLQTKEPKPGEGKGPETSGKASRRRGRWILPDTKGIPKSGASEGVAA